MEGERERERGGGCWWSHGDYGGAIFYSLGLGKLRLVGHLAYNGLLGLSIYIKSHKIVPYVHIQAYLLNNVK